MFKKHKWRLIFQLWTMGYRMPELVCESFPKDDNATKDMGELEMLIYAGEQRVFQNGPGSYILYYGAEPELRNMDIYLRIDELQKKLSEAKTKTEGTDNLSKRKGFMPGLGVSDTIKEVRDVQKEKEPVEAES